MKKLAAAIGFVLLGVLSLPVSRWAAAHGGVEWTAIGLVVSTAGLLNSLAAVVLALLVLVTRRP